MIHEQRGFCSGSEGLHERCLHNLRWLLKKKKRKKTYSQLILINNKILTCVGVGAIKSSGSDISLSDSLASVGGSYKKAVIWGHLVVVQNLNQS
jgi:hypothetical protein